MKKSLLNINYKNKDNMEQILEYSNLVGLIFLGMILLTVFIVGVKTTINKIAELIDLGQPRIPVENHEPIKVKDFQALQNRAKMVDDLEKKQATAKQARITAGKKIETLENTVTKLKHKVKILSDELGLQKAKTIPSPDKEEEVELFELEND